LIESRGCIVNIASESSPFRAPFQIYQSTKMALKCLSDVMRRDLVLFDVHVATIRPGAIDTNLIKETMLVPIEVKASRFERFFPRLREMIRKPVPKRLSQPSEMAAVVYKAATDPKRKVMYRIDNDPIQRIVPWFPAKLVDRLISRQLRL
jgi:NAD(P)-dependent dehydrogenase (short-subunit alcohol dehydrogenase family)